MIGKLLPPYLPTYRASPFSDKSLRAATKDRFVRANIRYDPTEPSRTRTFLKQADIWRPAVAAALATPCTGGDGFFLSP